MSKHVLQISKIFKIVVIFICICRPVFHAEFEEDEIENLINSQFLTCTTTARIQNKASKFHLHSHPINYGSGSGQQTITGLESKTDVGSLWIFKEAEGEKMCLTGEPIPCGSHIRLEHMGTQKNLHTHDFPSPVSGRQEVSGFGENGKGDKGDNWIIECKDSLKGDKINGRTEFYLKHQLTGNYLYTDSRSMFNHQNCRNCPIVGQAEISSTRAKNQNGLWRFVGGYFFSHDNTGDFGLGDIVEEDTNYNDDYFKEDL